MPRIPYHIVRKDDGEEIECGKAFRLYRRVQLDGKSKWDTVPYYICWTCGDVIRKNTAEDDSDFIIIR